MLCVSLPAVTQFNRTLYPNGVRIYKQLTDKSAPRVDIGADTDGVPFGIGVAYDGGELSFTWRVNGRFSRVDGDGAVAVVTPSLTDEDMDPTLEVQVTIIPEGQGTQTSSANLTLLGQHTRTHTHTHTHTLNCNILHRPSNDY